MKNRKPSSKTLSPSEERRPVKLRLSNAAKLELEAIDAFSFEQFGDDVATTYMRRFDELFDRLRHHPLAGREASDIGRDMRSVTHRKHRILYQVGNNEILIVRILHHAMDANGALREAAR